MVVAEAEPLAIGGDDGTKLRVSTAETACTRLVGVHTRIGQLAFDFIEFVGEFLATFEHCVFPATFPENSSRDKRIGRRSGIDRATGETRGRSRAGARKPYYFEPEPEPLP